MASVSLFFKMGRIIRPSVSTAALALAATTACLTCPTSVEAWSSFHGSSLHLESPASSSSSPTQPPPSGATSTIRRGILQKASDKRTRRLQRSGALLEEEMLGSTPIPPPQRRRGSTASPMDTAAWKQRKIRNAFPSSSSSSSNRAADATNRGRGRSRKRSQLYSRLATYNNDFVALLTAEYRAEVRIYGRRTASWRARISAPKILVQKMSMGTSSNPKCLFKFKSNLSLQPTTLTPFNCFIHSFHTHIFHNNML